MRKLSSAAGCLALVVAIGAAAPASAAERLLKGPEITTLLTGNTVAGQTNRGSWKQYFDMSGSTDYVLEGGKTSHGAWQVKGDDFCSQWPPNDGWTCYSVRADLEVTPHTIVWTSEGGTTYPGTVQPGKGL